MTRRYSIVKPAATRMASLGRNSIVNGYPAAINPKPFSTLENVAGSTRTFGSNAPPGGAHSAFVTTWSDALPSATREGLVHYRDLTVAVEVETKIDRTVHAVGWSVLHEDAPRPELLADLRQLDEEGAPWSDDPTAESTLLSARELDAVHSPASAAVRIGAKSALAGALDIESARIEIVCAPGSLGRRPPRVLLDGEAANIDVSLAHDGLWLAWVLWIQQS